jgi:DNA-binding IclR family transcriptional regulator
MSARTDNDYAIDALAKGLKVLEALEGNNFEPVSIKRVSERTRLPYDTCRNALITLKLEGFATQNERGLWAAGPKLLRFSKDFHLYCLGVMEAESSEISEL